MWFRLLLLENIPHCMGDLDETTGPFLHQRVSKFEQTTLLSRWRTLMITLMMTVLLQLSVVAQTDLSLHHRGPRPSC